MTSSITSIVVHVEALKHDGPTEEIVTFEIKTILEAGGLVADQVDLQIMGSEDHRTFTFRATDLLEAISRASISTDADAGCEVT